MKNVIMSEVTKGKVKGSTHERTYTHTHTLTIVPIGGTRPDLFFLPKAREQENTDLKGYRNKKLDIMGNMQLFKPKY